MSIKPLVVLLLASPLFAQSYVVAHGNAQQTSAVSSQYLFQPSFASRLVSICTVTGDGGFMWAQPLVVDGQTVNGATHNMLIEATNHNTMLAVDSDTCAPLWSTSLSSQQPNSADVPADYGGDGIGCFATPAIDVSGAKIYEVCKTSTLQFYLYEINLLTGAVINLTPISASVSGTGDGSSGGTLPFYPNYSMARPGLVLANGNVYISFGGWDRIPWHGWVMSYDASTLVQNRVFCTSPNGSGGSVWMSGGAPAVDANGNLYITTGNGGNYDGVTEFTETVLKLSPTLIVLDWFTPSNWATLNTDDADVSSSRVLLIPGTNYAIVAAKDYNVYVLDTTCMGHVQGSSGCFIQTFPTGSGPITSGTTGSYGMTFFNNTLFLPTTSGDLYAFTWDPTTHLFNSTPLWHDVYGYGFPGPAQLSGSVDANGNGILWYTASASTSLTTPQAGVLHAVNPATGVEYWNSGTSLGNLSKYIAPTIADNHVILASQSNKITIYGLAYPTQINSNVTLSGSTTIK